MDPFWVEKNRISYTFTNADHFWINSSFSEPQCCLSSSFCYFRRHSSAFIHHCWFFFPLLSSCSSLQPTSLITPFHAPHFASPIQLFPSLVTNHFPPSLCSPFLFLYILLYFIDQFPPCTHSYIPYQLGTSLLLWLLFLHLLEPSKYGFCIIPLWLGCWLSTSVLDFMSHHPT